MAERPALKFLTDNCVPDSVAHALRDAGYEVILLREILAMDAPDPVVAAAAEAQNAVLITFDNDLKALARISHTPVADWVRGGRVPVEHV